MPIDYWIDPLRRVVLARCHGILTDQEVFDYQRDVWSRHDLAGYDELVDASQIERIDLPSTDRVIDLASLSAQMDAPNTSSRLAIVASENRAFGLGRMYQTYRELNERNTRQVCVFRTLPAALQWLGLNDLDLDNPDTWQSKRCS